MKKRKLSGVGQDNNLMKGKKVQELNLSKDEFTVT